MLTGKYDTVLFRVTLKGSRRFVPTTEAKVLQ